MGLACKFRKVENTKGPHGPDGQKLGGKCAAGGIYASSGGD